MFAPRRTSGDIHRRAIMIAAAPLIPAKSHMMRTTTADISVITANMRLTRGVLTRGFLYLRVASDTACQTSISNTTG